MCAKLYEKEKWEDNTCGGGGEEVEKERQEAESVSSIILEPSPIQQKNRTEQLLHLLTKSSSKEQFCDEKIPIESPRSEK